MMTMPHLMNCSHSDEGWCLGCVKEQNEELEALREVLYSVCERLNDGSAWADESEEFFEMCKLSGHSHPALAAGKSDDE